MGSFGHSVVITRGGMTGKVQENVQSNICRQLCLTYSPFRKYEENIQISVHVWKQLYKPMWKVMKELKCINMIKKKMFAILSKNICFFKHRFHNAVGTYCTKHRKTHWYYCRGSHRQQQRHSGYSPLGGRQFGSEVEAPDVRGPAPLGAVHRALVSTFEFLLLRRHSSRIQRRHGRGQIPRHRLSDDSSLSVPASS